MDTEKKAHLKEKAAEELRLLVLITVYLAVFFVSFDTYKRLLQRDEGVSAFRYGYALFEALIVAKVILIGKAIGIGKNAGRRTVAWAVVRSSLFYGLLVLAFEILEEVVVGLIHHKTLVASFEGFLDRGVHEIAGKGLILFVVFLPFFAFWELSSLVGEKKLFELFFKKDAAPKAG
jgi:hypothetical protein